MIEDIVFENPQYFELEISEAENITYSMVILFGSDNSTDIIQTERISVL